MQTGCSTNGAARRTLDKIEMISEPLEPREPYPYNSQCSACSKVRIQVTLQQGHGTCAKGGFSGLALGLRNFRNFRGLTGTSAQHPISQNGYRNARGSGAPGSPPGHPPDIPDHRKASKKPAAPEPSGAFGS